MSKAVAVSVESRDIARQLLKTANVNSPRDLVDQFIKNIPTGQESAVLRQLAEEYLVQQSYVFRTVTRQRLRTSTKAATVRNAWQALLQTMEFDPVEREWMQLGDAQHANLMNMAAGHIAHAVSHQRRAAQFEALANALTASGKTKVSELPMKTVDDVLQIES